MANIEEVFENIGIVPVIKIDDVETALPLCKALIDGGVPIAEITFRTAQGEEAIKLATKAYPDMLIGAGTVLTIDQVDRAVKAGAKFIVAPGFNPRIVAHCQEIGIPVFPGCVTPSEIEQALEFGLKTLKFFPAESFGGVKMMKALSAPYTGIRFMPTGGINLDNLETYLSFKKIVACGGSFMVGEEILKNRDYAKITELCKKAVDIKKKVRG